MADKEHNKFMRKCLECLPSSDCVMLAETIATWERRAKELESMSRDCLPDERRRLKSKAGVFRSVAADVRMVIDSFSESDEEKRARGILPVEETPEPSGE